MGKNSAKAAFLEVDGERECCTTPCIGCVVCDVKVCKMSCCDLLPILTLFLITIGIFLVIIFYLSGMYTISDESFKIMGLIFLFIMAFLACIGSGLACLKIFKN